MKKQKNKDDLAQADVFPSPGMKIKILFMTDMNRGKPW